MDDCANDSKVWGYWLVSMSQVLAVVLHVEILLKVCSKVASVDIFGYLICVKDKLQMGL